MSFLLLLHCCNCFFCCCHSLEPCSIFSVSFLLFAAAKVHWAIHREAPLFVDQGVDQEILTTGIKVCCCLSIKLCCCLTGLPGVRSAGSRMR